MILMGAATLSACGELSPDEQVRLDVLVACLEKADAQFAALKDVPVMADEQSTAEIRVDPSGAFVWNVTVAGKDRLLPEHLTCRGNVNERTVESVEYNGVLKRPSAQEVWKF